MQFVFNNKERKDSRKNTENTEKVMKIKPPYEKAFVMATKKLSNFRN